jgi:AraC-like DNA-binding protein
LSDVIDTLRLSTQVHGVFELGAPFVIELGGNPAIDVQLVMVSRGSVVARLPKPITLSAGDLLLRTGPGALELADRVESQAPHVTASGCRQRSLEPFRAGGRGPQSVVVAVGLGLLTPLKSALHSRLPPMVVTPNSGNPALTAAATLFMQEAVSPRAGSLAVLSRLAEVLFIELLRREGERRGCEKGDLKALADPQLSQALGLMHASPAHDWTIEALGRAVGLSRSAFAARFSAKVGQAPLEYLSRWRMTRASRLLAESDASVSTIAAEVGYQSDAAFTKAFARVVGQSPARYRRALKSAGTSRHEPR